MGRSEAQLGPRYGHSRVPYMGSNMAQRGTIFGPSVGPYGPTGHTGPYDPHGPNGPREPRGPNGPMSCMGPDVPKWAHGPRWALVATWGPHGALMSPMAHTWPSRAHAGSEALAAWGLIGSHIVGFAALEAVLLFRSCFADTFAQHVERDPSPHGMLRICACNGILRTCVCRIMLRTCVCRHSAWSII